MPRASVSAGWIQPVQACVCVFTHGTEDREGSWHSCRQPMPLPNPQFTVFGWGGNPWQYASPAHPPAAR